MGAGEDDDGRGHAFFDQPFKQLVTAGAVEGGLIRIRLARGMKGAMKLFDFFKS